MLYNLISIGLILSFIGAIFILSVLPPFVGLIGAFALIGVVAIVGSLAR
jgi:hypothetical protein